QPQMIAAPVIPRHELDHPGVVKIRLSAAASDALRDVGEYHLAVISRADFTAPTEAQGRMILHVIELSKEAATAVSRVALGNHVARPRPMPATPVSSSASSPMNSLP
ncbi:MAG: hypothetical protein WCO57_16880, partial [Verrucomicrobiota bacterium]